MSSGVQCQAMTAVARSAWSRGWMRQCLREATVACDDGKVRCTRHANKSQADIIGKLGVRASDQAKGPSRAQMEKENAE